MSYPENLESICIRFKKILLDYVKLSEEILMDAGELDTIHDGMNFEKYRVITSGLNHFKRYFKRHSQLQEGEDEDDYYQYLYDKYIDLFYQIYNDYADDIVSDEIDDGWIVDNPIKIWVKDKNGNNMKNRKSKIGVMFCISEIYNYSLDLLPDEESAESSDESNYSDEIDIDNKYPEKCLYYLYSIFNLICTKQDSVDIKESMEYLGKETGLLRKQQLPDFKALFNSESLEGIGSIAEDVITKLEPELEEDMPEFKKLSEEEKEKRRKMARAKTKKLLKGDFLGNMVDNVGNSFVSGEGKFDTNNISSGVKSFMKNMKEMDEVTVSDDSDNESYEDKNNDDEESDEGVFDD